MQRNSIISLRPAATWQRILGSASADARATYGCVDWYLYQNPAAIPVDSPATRAGATATGSRSSIIERAAAAAGAMAAAAARATSPPDSAARRSAG